MYSPKDEYPGQIDNTDGAFPEGKAQNITTPGDGTGTPFEKKWLNDVFGFFQACLAHVGASPSGNAEEVGTSQVLNALQADATETKKGMLEVGTDAEVTTGTADNKTVTPVKLETRLASVFAKSLAANGYQKLHSGLVIQWGTVAIASHPAEYDFGNLALPITFPNAALSAGATTLTTDTPSAIESHAAINNVTTTTINPVTGATSANAKNIGIFWYAIGY